VLEAQGFSGVVRVDRDGKTLLEKGYGLANRADKIPFSPSTVVQIGSNTKDFTIVALLQLQERGKLNLRDTLGKFFPAAPADKRAITLQQLSDHTAGFPIGLGGDFDALSRDQFLAAAFARPLASAPGARRQYSNTGYALLAAVIEQVAGTSYDVYVRDNLLKPLGLTNTGFLLPNFESRRLAHGYRANDDQGTMLTKPHAQDGPYWNLRGNGGMLSTVGDMHAFYKALFETTILLKPETRALRFNPDEPIGLAGSDLVNFFLYERLPGRHVEVIIASNTAEFRERPVRAAIAAVLGLPSDNQGPPSAGWPRANAKAPTAAVASMANAFVVAVNSGDAAVLTRFITDNFIIEPGSPTAEQRAQRMLGVHASLGALKVLGMDQIDAVSLEVGVTSDKEGPATIKISIEPAATPKIRSIGMLVGG
jgi:CubicO group peptidase (beta-lactamase class C family)